MNSSLGIYRREGKLRVRFMVYGINSQPGTSSESHLGPFLHKRLKVLVVDDMPDNADTLAALIEGHGHIARAAYNARDGIAIAYQWLPSVIFHDLAMPGMTGFEAVRILRADKLFEHVSIIALSAYAGQADSMSRYRGFDRILTKPISAEELSEILRA